MHLIAFNLEYEKSGAGVLLLEQSLKNGYAEGLTIYDMLAPATPTNSIGAISRTPFWTG